MPERSHRFDAESVAAEWDYAADAYAEMQATGRDYYRYEFFGPAQVAMCGDVRGLAVLDLGCGTGYFSREMAVRGARVTGVDISARQVEHARREERERPLGIEYRVLDAATVGEAFPPGSFDMVTACVSLQDMPDAPGAIRGAHAVLRPGGRLVACITHPCTDTPHRRWVLDGAGEKAALEVGGYFDRGPMVFRWESPRFRYAWQTTSIHATLSDWFGWILGAGFQVRGVAEPVPSAEAAATRPELADACVAPTFLLLDAVRP